MKVEGRKALLVHLPRRLASQSPLDLRLSYLSLLSHGPNAMQVLLWRLGTPTLEYLHLVYGLVLQAAVEAAVAHDASKLIEVLVAHTQVS